MKIILLTTDTLHHKYYINRLIEVYDLELIIVEINTYKPPFDIAHSFELIRENYESEVMFQNSIPEIDSYKHVFFTDQINSVEVKERVDTIKPDVVIVFGNSKLSQAIIDTCPNGIINLHGGDPEEYRGLDSHLWAIYHNDFSNIITTIHHLNSKLDEGDILFKLPVDIHPKMKLLELRKSNTDTCVELTKLALNQYIQEGKFVSKKQIKKGRYYSYMPSVLKEIVCQKFEKHTAKL
jgi:methionyl-tRNA formyltransferase